MKTGINPPRTPVTKGSNGVAVAAVPNVCKMPGPPAPFVPTPLPNIGKSGSSPKGYSKKVRVEGKPVAIKGATFGSQGDMASKGTGGGLISANVHGPTAFVGLGSLDVSFEGKAVHLLGEPMTNNNGSPPNASSAAVFQGAAAPALPDFPLNIDCEKKKAESGWDDCMVAQVCMMVGEVEGARKKGELRKVSPSPRSSPQYKTQLEDFKNDFRALVESEAPDSVLKQKFYSPPPPNEDCVFNKWAKGSKARGPRSTRLSGRGNGTFNPDHKVPAALGGKLEGFDNLIWAEQRVNSTVGPAMKPYDPEKHGKMTAPKCC